MSVKNHTVIFTARNKEVTYDLLNAYNINYIPYGRPYKSAIGKLIGLIKFDIQLFKISLKFKPDIFLGHGSFYASHVAFLLRKPFITFEDTGNKEQIILYKYFSNAIITPNSFKMNISKNQFRFNGTKELAYLHPKQFQPSISILDELKINSDEKYVIIRFVGWNASHDIGHTGISIENKIKLVSELSKFAKVFISSESTLPKEIKDFCFPLSPNKMKDAMAFASLVFGESATMVAEGAVLGVPGIYLDNTGRTYTNELEKKYDLVFNYTESLEDQVKAIEKAKSILLNFNRNEWIERRNSMLKDKIDLTSFLVWFIENYPESKRIMKENPDFQYNFK